MKTFITIILTINVLGVVYGLYTDCTWLASINALSVGLNFREVFD